MSEQDQELKIALLTAELAKAQAQIQELKDEVDYLNGQVQDLEYLIERNWEDYQRDIRQLEDDYQRELLALESDLNDQSL